MIGVFARLVGVRSVGMLDGSPVCSRPCRALNSRGPLVPHIDHDRIRTGSERGRTGGARRRPKQRESGKLQRYRRSPVAIGAVFLAVMAFAGLLMVSGAFGGHERAQTPTTTGCGTEDCAVAAIGARPTAIPKPRMSSSPSPSPAVSQRTALPSPTPSRTPKATVAFVPGNGGGSYVIVNRGDAPLPTWRLTFTYPRGHVTVVSPGTWTKSGKTVTVSGGQIPPGGQVTVRFESKGPSATPESCTLNSKSCA